MPANIRDCANIRLFLDRYEAGPADAILPAMVETHERFGRKNGKGFYDYHDQGKSLWSGLDEFAESGWLEPQPAVSDLKDRILYAQAVEAARTFAEGIVTDPREADLGSILGWGFAVHTGGVLSFIDTIGPAAFVRRADRSWQ